MNNETSIWDQLEDTPGPYSTSQAKNPVSQIEESKVVNWDSLEDADKPESFGQAVASSVPVQLGLGVSRTATAPADLYKLWATAEAMQGMQELEEQGIKFDKQKYLEAVEQATSMLPTQELAEKAFEKYTGINLEPKTDAGKFARQAGEYINPKGLLEKGGKALLKSIGKKATAGATGAATEETLKAAGVPTPLAVLPAALASGSIASKKVTKALTPEAQKLENIANKHGLEKFAVMFEDNAKFGNASVSKKTLEKAKERLATANKESINRIIEKKIPLAKAVREGKNAKDIYDSAYDMAFSRADESIKKVDMDPIVKWIDKEIVAIESKVPSPSKGQEKVLSILKEERRKLVEKNPEYKETVSKILDQHGRPIEGPKVPKVISKKISARQDLDQFQAYNENVNGIYRKPEMAGIEEDVVGIYGKLNDKLVEAMVQSGNKEVALPFRVANNIFHQKSKLEQTYKILEKGLEDPKKLDAILRSKKAGFLERNLGKEALKDLGDIAKYSQAAEKKVFEQLKVKPDFLEDMKNWGKIATVISAGISGGTSVGIGALALIGGKEGLSRIKGNLMLSDTSRKSYKRFLQAVSSGSESAIKRYAGELDRTVEKEYGSIDNFFQNL